MEDKNHEKKIVSKCDSTVLHPLGSLSPPDLPCAPCRSTAANPRGFPWTWFWACLFVWLAATTLENADTAAGLFGGVPWDAGPFVEDSRPKITSTNYKSIAKPGSGVETPQKKTASKQGTIS